MNLTLTGFFTSPPRKTTHPPTDDLLKPHSTPPTGVCVCAADGVNLWLCVSCIILTRNLSRTCLRSGSRGWRV